MIELRLIARPSGFPGGSGGKESACNMGYLRSIPGLGWEDPLEEGMALQYSCLENPMDRGAATGELQSRGSAKSWTRLSDEAHTERTEQAHLLQILRSSIQHLCRTDKLLVIYQVRLGNLLTRPCST